ncbi:hypothetical protein GP419_002601 [Enterococcus faecalis]|nr:hypothetical protein [Enterococcus faecalis]
MRSKKIWITTLSIISILTTAGVVAYAQDSGATYEKDVQTILANTKEVDKGEMIPIPKSAIMLEKNIVSENN